MFNRIELKTNAKRILSENYWWIVVVTLIFGIIGGADSGVFELNFNENQSEPSYTSDEFIANDFAEINDNGILNSEININEFYSEIEKIINSIAPEMIMLVLWIFVIILAISIALSTFVLNPLIVGCRRWYIKNRKEKPNIDVILHVFSNGYLNTVKVMFCKGLFTFLWSLLFVIPGIIKSYEYRMIPFLLAENPNMDMHEAFERSRILMDGNKWDTFVLDLSFFGWDILAACTCGILGVLYVNPYVELTNTELYVCLCNRSSQ